MRKIKKALRLIGVVVMVVLASFGVGLSGGATIPVSKRREGVSIQTELLEEDKETEEAGVGKEKI
ncbi:hypothetical protein [Pedobacter sp.]|uniref:hypothetical protein n=1 Tax=Pedobacter sp. TaxID=1411316 RepID=UPI0031E2583C